MARDEPAIVWGITDLQGAICLPTIRTTRRLCIHDYVRLPGNSGVDRKIANRWGKLHKWGWRCVKIEVRHALPRDGEA